MYLVADNSSGNVNIRDELGRVQFYYTFHALGNYKNNFNARSFSKVKNDTVDASGHSVLKSNLICS